MGGGRDWCRAFMKCIKTQIEEGIETRKKLHILSTRPVFYRALCCAPGWWAKDAWPGFQKAQCTLQYITVCHGMGILQLSAIVCVQRTVSEPWSSASSFLDKTGFDVINPAQRELSVGWITPGNCAGY